MSTSPAPLTPVSNIAPVQLQAQPPAPATTPKLTFLQKIKADVHTFAAWATGELAKLVKAEPEIETVADSILKYVGGALSIVAGVEGGPAGAAAVSAAVAEAQTGVIALNGLITDFGATPTATSIATSISTNLGSLLAAGKVTNPTSVAAVTGIVNNLTTLATALGAASKP